MTNKQTIDLAQLDSIINVLEQKVEKQAYKHCTVIKGTGNLDTSIAVLEKLKVELANLD